MAKLRRDMRISCIDTFIRLARLRSQPAVAKEMRCDQATVSRNITALEEWMRRVLVFTGSPIELTPDGERFLPIAVEVMRLMEEMRGSAVPLRGLPKISGKDIDVPSPHPGANGSAAR